MGGAEDPDGRSWGSRCRTGGSGWEERRLGGGLGAPVEGAEAWHGGTKIPCVRRGGFEEEERRL